MAAIRARDAEREKEKAAREKAARAREEAAEAAAERQREDRLKAVARRRAAEAPAASPQTPGRPRESGDLPKPAPAAEAAPASATAPRLTPQGDSVDARIRSLMRDPRYWKERDPGLLDHVARQWRRAYPGESRHTGFRRPDPHPALRPEEVEPWPPTEADPQPQPLPARRDEGPLHPRPAVQTPGWAWNDRTGRWERMTPEEAAAEEARLARGPTPREAAEGERPTPAQDDPNRPPVSTSAGVAPEAGETRKERRDKRGRMEPQSSISLNSIKYGRMHEILQEGEGAVRSQWFGAAADVTSLDSLGVLDSATGWMVDERAAEVMRGIHHKLAPANYALFNQLRKGELPEGLKGLSGKDLDYALVEREQALVQQHLDAELAKLPEAERAEVTAELSRLINLEGVERLVADQIGDGGVRNAVAQSFPKGGFDFSNQAHREALGKAMIDLRYRVLP